jgi:hypothetical protein
MFSLSTTSVALTGTGANANFVVSYDLDTQMYDFSGGSTAPVSVPASQLQSFSLVGAGGSDTLMIEGGSPTLSNDAGTDGTSLSIEVTSGSTLNFDSTEHLSSLTVDSGAAATMLGDGSRVLETNALSIAGSTDNWLGILDLSNNGLIVHNGNLPTITNQIKAGFDGSAGGNWQGEGITSSAVANDPSHLTSLGVVQNSANGAPSGPALYPHFASQPVVNSDVLVTDTFFGDANLDGRVDGSDYTRIDNGYLTNAMGWFNGDFNYDGVINGSDYTLVDNAFNTQTGPSSPATVAEDQPTTLTLNFTGPGQIDWGDGGFTQWTTSAPTSSQLTHSYSAPGNYTIGVASTAAQPIRYFPSIETTVLPAAPTGLTATESNPGEVDLSWSANATLFNGFIVTVMPTSGTPVSYSVGSGTFSYQVTGLQTDEPYTFSVVAESQLSDGSTLLSAPATVSATPAGGTLSITGPQTVLEDSVQSLNLSSGAMANITNWSLTWTDVNGGVISTVPVSGPNGTVAYPTQYIPELIAKVTAYDSAGNSFQLPDFDIAVVAIGFTGITGGPDALISVNNINATATQQFSGVVATFTSTDSPSAIANYTATINWGDGNTGAGTIAALGGDLYSVTAAHTYSLPDVAPLLVQIDNGSGDPANGLGTATISDHLTIANPATATLQDDGLTVDLSALGQDAAGPDQLQYSWTVTGAGASSVVFDDNNDNEAQTTFATLSAAGNYDFVVTISNPSGQSVTSDMPLMVAQVASDVSVTSPFPSVAIGQTLQFTASALDQFGSPMTVQPSFTWQSTDKTLANPPGSSISQSGLYTAPNYNYDTAPYYVGNSTITATVTNTGIEGAETITITPGVQFAAAVTYVSYGQGYPQNIPQVNLTVPPSLLSPSLTATDDVRFQLKAPYDTNFTTETLDEYRYTYPNAADYTSVQISGVRAYSTPQTWYIRISDYNTQTCVVTYSPTLSFSIEGVSGNGSVPTLFNEAPISVAQRYSYAAPFEDASGRSVRLMWSEESGEYTNTTGFAIQRSVDGGQTFTPLTTIPADAQSYIDPNPPAGVPLVYEIAAYNSYGYSSYTIIKPKYSQYTVPNNYYAVELPGIPTNLTAQADSTNAAVDLSWNYSTTSTNYSSDKYTYGFEVQSSTDGTNFYTIGNVIADNESSYTSNTQNYTFIDNNPVLGNGVTNYYRILSFDPSDPNTLALAPISQSIPADSNPIESDPSNVAHTSVVADPIAVDDTDGGNNADGTSAPYQVAVGKTLNASQGVLANDYDLQGLTLTVYSNTQPSHGTVVVNSNGSFSYVPNGSGFTGIDSFTYIATNGTHQSDPAEVDIDVANAPIVTQPDSYQLAVGQTLSEPAGALGLNDSNPSNAAVTYMETPGDTGPAHGTLHLNSDGSFTYTPNSGYAGLDHFSYQVSDGVISNASTVVLAVGTEYYSPPTSSTVATAVPPQLATFPNSLQGLWNSWQAARDRLGQVAVALQNFGKASAACATIDTTTAGTPAAQQLLDSALAAQAILNQDYNAYSLQQQAAVNLAGEYQKTVYYTSSNDFQALNAISALPLSVLGLGPDQAQLNKYRLAFENYANGADFMVANNTFVVEVAKDTHDALQTSIKAAGIYSIAETGAEILTEQGCALFVQYATQQIVNTAVGVVAAQVSQSAIALAAQFAGLNINPDYLRIGADAMQVFFLVKAARAEKLAQGANCFSGTTIVQTGSGPDAISQIQDGDRVLTNVAETPDQGGPLAPITSPTAVDPATWREVSLTMPDPTTPGDSYNMQLLEPFSWITANQASVGNWVSLNLPELQISGDAQVESIEACPTIQSGPGQVVLGTFEHISNDVVDVNLVRESQPLQVTAGHKLWSLDADGWVDAASLYAGERLAGENGPVIVASVTADPEMIPVYNLDVENDHRYLVTDLGVLAHNAEPCPSMPVVENSQGLSYEIPNGAEPTPDEIYAGKLLNNEANAGNLPGIKKVSCNNTPIANGQNPDYTLELDDGTTQSGDLISPGIGTPISNIMSRISQKGTQTAGGTVICRIDGSSATNAELISAVENDVFTTPGSRPSRVILLRGTTIVADLYRAFYPL